MHIHEKWNNYMGKKKISAGWREVIEAPRRGITIFKISVKLYPDRKSLMIGKLSSVDVITMSGFNLAFNIVSLSEFCNS